jgi:hypothetical protein
MIIGYWEVLRTIWEFLSKVATVLTLGSANGLRRAGLTRARKNMVEERGSQLQNKIIPVFFPRRYSVLCIGLPGPIQMTSSNQRNSKRNERFFYRFVLRYQVPLTPHVN